MDSSRADRLRCFPAFEFVGPPSHAETGIIKGDHTVCSVIMQQAFRCWTLTVVFLSVAITLSVVVLWPANCVCGWSQWFPVCPWLPFHTCQRARGLLSPARLSLHHLLVLATANKAPNARISSYINWMNPARFSSRPRFAFVLHQRLYACTPAALLVVACC